MHVFWPVGQVHALFTQLLPVGHVLPQPPQLFSSLAVETHVPASPAAAQKWSTPGHMHMPPWHGAPPMQTVPHPPQLFGSFIGSMQTPLHTAPEQASAASAPASPPFPPSLVPVPPSAPVPVVASSSAMSDWNG